MEPPPSPWKRPNEVMKLHRLKKRKIALQERMKQPSVSTSEEASSHETSSLHFSRLIEGDKRKNPFSKSNQQESKKAKTEYSQLDESNDKTLFALLNLPAKVVEKPSQTVDTDKLSTFSNLLQKFTAEHSVERKVTERKSKVLPIDWALTYKLRLMSPKPFAWTPQLKASEEASGITGFVRCLDPAALDTSPRARFHQSCLYWQHPALPWLQLFPRAARVAAGAAHGEELKGALMKDWVESFRSLFQLLRALHCPYFYVCANTFTCLFRAAGVGGGSEPCALITPTTRGFRQTLRQEDVEFTMPLRPDKKRLNTSDEDKPKSASFDSCYDTMDAGADDAEDEDPDAFLSQLGLEAAVLNRINNTQARIVQNAESSVDSAAESLVLVRGADAQALFNYLLNCRSLAAAGGALAGVPPTLLAPVAFHGAALQALAVRSNVLYADNTKYHSLELRGPLLPSAARALLASLEEAGAPFSATFARLRPTAAFSTAAAQIAAEEASKENEPTDFSKAFNKENLSDCGISERLLRQFCSAEPGAVAPLDSVKFDPEDGSYSW